MTTKDPKTGNTTAEDSTAEDSTAEDGWVAPTKEKWDAIQENYAAARREAADRRKWLAAAGIDHHTGKPLPGQGGATESDSAKAAAELAEYRARAEKREAAVLRTAVTAALRAAGATDKTARLLAGQVDLGELDVTDDGKVAGLDAEVTRLEAEFSDLFAAPKKTKRESNAAAGGGRRDAAPPADPAAAFAAQLMGGV